MLIQLLTKLHIDVFYVLIKGFYILSANFN